MWWNWWTFFTQFNLFPTNCLNTSILGKLWDTQILLKEDNTKLIMQILPRLQSGIWAYGWKIK